MSDTLPTLLPCPFCGKAHTMKLTTAQELAEEGEDDPEPWMHSDSFGVLCDASHPGGPGGCGASSGFFPSEREAVEAWNRRVAPPEPATAPENDQLRWQLRDLDFRLMALEAPIQYEAEMRKAASAFHRAHSIREQGTPPKDPS